MTPPRPSGALTAARRGAAVVVALAWVLSSAGWSTLGAQVPDPSTTYRIAQWTTAEGLPQSTVNDALSLPSGELWLATFGGLARFDGQSFKVLDIAFSDRLHSNRIVALEPLPGESFLFLSQEGHLGRVDPGLAVTPLVAAPAAPTEFLQLARRGDLLYARSSNGRLWLTNGQHPWQAVEPTELKGEAVRSLATSGDGEIWASTDRAFVKLDGTRLGARVARPPGNSTLAARLGGGLWLGVGNQVGRLDGTEVGWLEVQPPVADEVVRLESAADDALLVATATALLRLNRQPDGTYRRELLPSVATQNLPVRVLMRDTRDALWVGTAGGGLRRLNRFAARRSALGIGATGALVDDGHGGAVAAIGCGRLFHLDVRGAIGELHHGQASPPCQLSLARASSGLVWLRIGSKLMRVDAPAGALTEVAGNLPDEEGALVANRDGTLWVLSRSGTVQRRSAEGLMIEALQLPPPLIAAAAGRDDSLWVGGDGQLFRVKAGVSAVFGEREHVPRGQVRDIVPDDDGSVWIGTYGGGVGHLHNGHVVRYNGAHGLPDNAVSRMMFDGRGRLWISTNRGVAIVEKSELLELTSGRRRTVVPVLLGLEHGVGEANFGSPAGFIDAADTLWFGTIDGVVTIEGASFPFDATPPPVRIEAITTDKDEFGVGASVITIPPGTARVRINFTALDLLYPEQLRFRFRIENFDPDWVDVGASRFANLTPPGPGVYRVLVEARSAAGVWSAAPAVVELHVLPAWWQTSTARGVAALTFVVIGAAGVSLRIRAMERRHAAELQEVAAQRETELRISSLRAQLEHVARAALAGELAANIAHEIRQPIGAIVNNAEAGARRLPEYMKQPKELECLLRDIVSDAMRASDIIRGLREFLQPIGHDAGPVNLSVLVKEVLPLVQRDLRDHHVGVELDLDGGLPMIDGYRVQLSQIVINLVTNAVEALSQMPGDRRLVISTAATDSNVELTVRDNGPGLPEAVRARAFEPFVTTKPGGLGVGLAISRSIAERHGGRLVMSPSSERGLTVTLSLPLKDEGESRS